MSGIFDPLAQTRDQAKRSAIQSVRSPDAAPMPKDKSARRERLRAARAGIAERERAVKAAVAEEVEAATTPRDEFMEIQLHRLFREATWIKRTGAFPDGKPLETQHRWAVEIWEVFLLAFDLREAGAKGMPEREPRDA